MSMSDPISDLLTRIRNAVSAGHEGLVAPYSKLKDSILSVLKSEGYIADFKTEKDSKKVVSAIRLKYVDGSSAFTHIERVSKPGCRVYSSCSDLPKFHGGLGIYVMSTSKGVMSDHEARRQNLGGEVLCKVF